MTGDDVVSLFSSFISIFIPIYLFATVNSITRICLTLPLILACLYLFSRIGDDGGQNGKKSQSKTIVSLYILAICILNFVSANAFVVIATLMTYALIKKIDGLVLNRSKKEVIIFSILFTLWAQFLVYKKALLVHGPMVIWQNLPFELIVKYFAEINIWDVIYYLGIIPLFCAVYVIYTYSLKKKDNQIDVFLSLMIVTFTLLILRMFRLDSGLILLGFCFVLLFGVFHKNIIEYLNKTKFSIVSKFVPLLFLLLFTFTAIIPSLIMLKGAENVPYSTVEALEWIRLNTPENCTILGTIQDGNLITEIAQRKNIIDTNFMLIEDVDVRVKDIRTMYISPSIVKAVELLDYYGIDYILLDGAREKYSIDDLRYSSSSKCLRKVFDKEAIVYEVTCKVEGYEQ